MYGILDRYIGKNVAIAVCLVAIALTLLSGIIHLIDALRYIGRGEIDFWFILKYVGYKLPGHCIVFFPVSVLIGGVVSLGLLARSSEIVILQSIGLSKINIGVSCIKTLIPMILVVTAISETVVPYLDRYAEEQYYQKAKANDGFTITSSGTWIKEGESFIGILAVSVNNVLNGVIRYDFEGTELKRYAIAASGQYINNQWVMSNVDEQLISDNKVEHNHYDNQVWSLNVNHKRMEVLSQVSSVLSFIQLKDYIKYIEQNGVDSSRYRLALYNKVVNPVVMIVMMLLALSTIFGPLRSMNMGTRVLSGIALGFGYYVLNQIVGPFALVYGVPPIIGAGFGTVLFAILAVYLLNRKA